MGEADDQAWLFVLAEPTLQQFSLRIADDLPEDMPVLRYAHAPYTDACSTADDSAAGRQVGSLKIVAPHLPVSYHQQAGRAGLPAIGPARTL
jgi:hypothetical protein